MDAFRPRRLRGARRRHVAVTVTNSSPFVRGCSLFTATRFDSIIFLSPACVSFYPRVHQRPSWIRWSTRGMDQGKINEAANQRGAPSRCSPFIPLFYHPSRWPSLNRFCTPSFIFFVSDVPSEQSVFVMLNGEESELRFLNIANPKVALRI